MGVNCGNRTPPVFIVTVRSHLPSSCLTPGKRHIIVIFVIAMSILPFVTRAGIVSGTSGNETDHLALFAIRSAIKDPLGALKSWNHSVHHCHWEGVVCGRRHNRVVALYLSSKGLGGTISPYIGNLSFLHLISLRNNTLGGPIPADIGFLFRLFGLYLNQNLLTGEIPSTVSNCRSLEYLSVAHNSLEGRIPTEFRSLSMLRGLYVHENNLSGPIFSTIQNLTSLEELSASYNAFDGIIPDAIGKMKNLSKLGLGSNLLSGIVPSSIYNLSSITVLSLGQNQLHGSLPTNIASAFPYLQILQLDSNLFTGTLPLTLSNISSLTIIDLSGNEFIGKVSWNLEHLKDLRTLHLRNNSLGSGDADDLSFLGSLVNCSNLEILSLGSNYFGGVLPNVIANLSVKLKSLELDHNNISGRIPAGMGRLSNLIQLALHSNQLSGTIPRDIGNLQNLERVYFSENMFTGTIPESLGNLPRLTELYLSENNFQGIIPSSLRNCQNLNYMMVNRNNLGGTIPTDLFWGSPHLLELGLGDNHFEGPLPSEVGQQKNLVWLDVSDNRLSGEIPGTLGSCSSLLNLYMQGNMFRGHIPKSLGYLRSIQGLDLSHNNLSGPIPAYLSKFPLTYLNFSYNNFEGEVPVQGVFANASAVSLGRNPELCGGILHLHLPRCTRKEVTGRKLSLRLKLIISCASALVGVAIVWSFYCMGRTKQRSSSLPVSSFGESFPRLSYEMLLKATEGFSSSNLLGAGTFGSVFEGVLEHSQMTVAVKVLNLNQPGASRGFVAECEALRNIRHRNLVGLLTACSSIDYQGNDFKALVYEFMDGGSLDSRLHSSDENQDGMIEVSYLNLLQRVNIALDVASALEYLHYGCEVPIVHRDLKPSNILLDNDTVAHVGDFGLAKFLPQPSHPNQSTSTGVKGTIGYAAPECGLGADPSTASDVYSYGIMVLEMMTRKRPVDNMFKEGLNLHTYVRMALPAQIVQIVDPRLLENEGYALNNVRSPRQSMTWMTSVVSVMNIGVACSMDSPKDRMSLKDASVELLKVRDSLTQVGRRLP